MNKFMNFLNNFLIFIRLIAPKTSIFSAVIAGVVWISDWLPKAIGHPEFAPVLTCVYMILIFVAFAYLTHLFLFHKIDLQDVGIRAIDENNLSAAVIFFSIIALFMTIILSLTILLR